jgi:hypothetical protein
LPAQERAELRHWVLAHGEETVDTELDSPELETELLSVAEESFAAYSRDEVRAVCERVASELRRS